MKRILAVSLLALALALPAMASADDCKYDDSQSHPLRILAYLVHPIGYALEWAIARPIHYVVSREGADIVFGHTPHDDYSFDEDYL